MRQGETETDDHKEAEQKEHSKMNIQSRKAKLERDIRFLQRQLALCKAAEDSLITLQELAASEDKHVIDVEFSSFPLAVNKCAVVDKDVTFGVLTQDHREPSGYVLMNNGYPHKVYAVAETPEEALYLAFYKEQE